MIAVPIKGEKDGIFIGGMLVSFCIFTYVGSLLIKYLLNSHKEIFL